MSTADQISTMLAGLALVVAAVVAFVAYLSPQGRFRRSAPAVAPMQAVSVRLVTRSTGGPGYWWRLEVTGDGASTSLDFLSFRRGTPDARWHHELMDAPLVITPPDVVYLRAPAPTHDGETYDVSVGWTERRAGATRQASTIMTVEPEPADTG